MIVLGGTVRGLIPTFVGASRAVGITANTVAELLVALALLLPLQVRICRLLVADSP